MFLSRFGVKNYKCLGDIDIPLTPIHVLIGENDAGKTSLLEAMAAFYASSEKRLPEVFPHPWSGRELVFRGSAEACVEFWGEWPSMESKKRVEPDSAPRYGFVVEFPVQGDNCRTPADWVEFGGEHHRLSPSVNTQNTEVCRRKLGQSRGEDTDPVVDFLSGAMKPAHAYSLEPKLMAVPAGIDPQRKFMLHPDGFGLPTLLDDILGYDPELFIRLREAFCEFFPQFRSVRVESEQAISRIYHRTGSRSTTGGVGKGIYFETQCGESIRAQHASDGAILFLGFLALAHLPDPPTLLLIEEPENGIYPKRLGEVIKLLKELVQRTEGVRFPQIIMSTHSPYVLSFFEPEEVTFLSRPPGKPDAPVRARPLRDAPNIHERLGSEFYLGELWYNLSEEELFDDA